MKEKEEPTSQSDHVTLSIFQIHGQELATKSPRNTMVFMAGKNGLTRPCLFQHRSTLVEKPENMNHESCSCRMCSFKNFSRSSHQGLHPMSYVCFFGFYMFHLTYTDTSDLQTAHLRSKDVGIFVWRLSNTNRYAFLKCNPRVGSRFSPPCIAELTAISVDAVAVTKKPVT